MSNRSRWVCLMYHGVLRDSTRRSADREWFAVTERDFGRQLDLILESGLSGCSIAQGLEGGGSHLAISFDDGMSSDYEFAFPALRERGMSATFFIVSDLIGTPGRVTWSQLREMRAAGMSVQSHTRTHPFLSELSVTKLRDELGGSKAAIDDALGQDTDQLALPGGDAPRGRLAAVLQETGYRVVATSRWGSNGEMSSSGLRYVRRCTIAGPHSDAHFQRVLASDWTVGLRRRAREGLLGSLRRALGPTRYAAWRRTFLGRHSPGVRR